MLLLLLLLIAAVFFFHFGAIKIHNYAELMSNERLNQWNGTKNQFKTLAISGDLQQFTTIGKVYSLDLSAKVLQRNLFDEIKIKRRFKMKNAE